MADHRQRVEELMRSFQERVDQVTQLSSKLHETRGTARSQDGAVTVTVAPSGAVLDLRLTPDAMKRSNTALQHDILHAIRIATQNAAQQLNSELEPILGDQLAQAKQAMNASGVTPIGAPAPTPPFHGDQSGSIMR